MVASSGDDARQPPVTTAPRLTCTSATKRHGTAAHRAQRVMAPWHLGPRSPWHPGTVAPWPRAPWHHGPLAHGTMVPMPRCGTMAPRSQCTVGHHGTTVPVHRVAPWPRAPWPLGTWHRGPRAPRGTMAPVHCGTVAPWASGSLAPVQCAPWQHGAMAPGHRRSMSPGHNADGGPRGAMRHAPNTTPPRSMYINTSRRDDNMRWHAESKEREHETPIYGRRRLPLNYLYGSSYCQRTRALHYSHLFVRSNDITNLEKCFTLFF